METLNRSLTDGSAGSVVSDPNENDVIRADTTSDRRGRSGESMSMPCASQPVSTSCIDRIPSSLSRNASTPTSTRVRNSTPASSLPGIASAPAASCSSERPGCQM